MVVSRITILCVLVNCPFSLGCFFFFKQANSMPYDGPRAAPGAEK